MNDSESEKGYIHDAIRHVAVIPGKERAFDFCIFICTECVVAVYSYFAE